MESKLRKYKSVDELPELPPELQREFEKIARAYAPVLKALAKF